MIIKCKKKNVFMSRLFGKYWTGLAWSRQVNIWVKFDNKNKEEIQPKHDWIDLTDEPKVKLLASLTGVCVCIQTKEAHHKRESCWQHQSLDPLYCLGTWLARQLWENKNIKLEETASGVHWLNHSNTLSSLQSSDLRNAVEGQQHFSGEEGLLDKWSQFFTKSCKNNFI